MKDEKSGVFKFRFDALTQTAQDSENRRATLKRLKKSLYPYKKKLWIFVSISLIYSVTYVIFPRLLGRILDLFSGSVVSYMLGIGDGSVFKEIIPYGVFALTVFVLNALLAFLQGHFISGVITDYSLSLRRAVTDKFNRLSVSYIDSADHKQLLSKMTDDIDALDQSLNIIFMRYISSALLFLCIIVMQFSLSFTAGAVSLLFCLVTALFSFMGQKREQKNAKRQQGSTFSLFDSASDFYSGISVVQLSGNLEKITKDLTQANRRAKKDTEKSRASSVMQNAVNELFNALCLVAVSVTGAFSIKGGGLTIGILQCQLIYVRRLFGAFSEFSMISGIMRTLVSSADSLFSFFDIAETEDADECEAMPSDEEEGTVKFENVSFRYSPESKLVLENVSVDFAQKGITALSGITGVGKTTAVKLMLGFYKPDSGRVLYKGKDVYKLPKNEYLSKFNIIIQGATLFNDTVYNNIAYGSVGVNREQVYEAARLCGADDFICKLEKGYDTVFNTAEPNLSQGEIQLVLLARAFLRKKEIVIFDEATSGIDIIAEKKINEALNILAEDSAVIVIAHRSSARAGAKKHISLSDGRVKVKITS